MKLAIISHTEHYLDEHGQIVGWGPTVREINCLLDIFEEIYHIGVFHSGPAPRSALPYASDRIHFVPIPPFGGPRWSDKFGVLRRAPQVIHTVRKVLQQVDCWQFRAPTGIGVFLIPWLSLFVRKPGWFKYAGNWAQENAPAGYRWQRFWLAHLQKRKVTINGRWPRQPGHCLSFENPCLDEAERIVGLTYLKDKCFQSQWDACFVGRLEDAKGARRLIKAFSVLDTNSGYRQLHLIGDGPQREEYEILAKSLAIHTKFHGFLSRADVAELLKNSHLFILPSTASEGFPKAIAEAANYGCLVMTSDISSIGQYIKESQSGFILPLADLEPDRLAARLQQARRVANPIQMAYEAYKMAGQFTFDRYITRISEEIIKVKDI